MTELLVQKIGSAFPLRELPCGEFASLKLNGMKFDIRRYAAENLGNVSVMQASGFLGLMKMETLIITPTTRDMPLLSYDRVHAMGNDILIFELYDTLLGTTDLSGLAEVKADADDLPDHDLGSHWYDSIKLPVSLSKKGKKKQCATAFDRAAAAYLDAFLSAAGNADPCSADAKREKSSCYVEGLLKNGGPSTDAFLKGIGKEKTAELFRTILFGTAAD